MEIRVRLTIKGWKKCKTKKDKRRRKRERKRIERKRIERKRKEGKRKEGKRKEREIRAEENARFLTSSVLEQGQVGLYSAAQKKVLGSIKSYLIAIDITF